MLINMLAVMVFEIYFEMGFYINAFFSVLLCYQLATGAGWGSLYAKASPRVDKIIGEFSYPIYLLHWQAGIIAAYLLLQEPVHNASLDGFKSLALAFVLVFASTFILIRAIDRPVQKWRMRVKAAA
jgi:peptidoglycan/LPS O-acetylase OafA/YrhL